LELELPRLLADRKRMFPDFRPGHKIPEWVNVGDIAGMYLSEALAGQISAENALKSADKDIEKLMSDAGYY
jgi:hypothetical protein